MKSEAAVECQSPTKERLLHLQPLPRPQTLLSHSLCFIIMHHVLFFFLSFFLFFGDFLRFFSHVQVVFFTNVFINFIHRHHRLMLVASAALHPSERINYKESFRRLYVAENLCSGEIYLGENQKENWLWLWMDSGWRRFRWKEKKITEL